MEDSESGFLGDLLKRRLLDSGFSCVSIDLEKDDYSHPSLVSVQGDIRDQDLMRKIFSERGFDAIFHCAAILALKQAAPMGIIKLLKWLS